jgi:alpha-beta hydrolase superfamily lysophospholipase
MVHYYDDPKQVAAPSTASTIVVLSELETLIMGNIDKLALNMHIVIGSEENIVSRVNLIKITKEAPGEVKEYLEFPGVNHYVLNDGIYLQEVIDSQIEFLDRMVDG